MTLRWVAGALVMATMWCGLSVPLVAASQTDPEWPAGSESGRRGGQPSGRVQGAGRAQLPSPEGRTVAQVEQLFDRYVLGQARQALRLDRDQMRQFAPRLQHLQQTRRRAVRQRQTLLRELNDLTRASGTADQAALSSKLAALEQQ